MGKKAFCLALAGLSLAGCFDDPYGRRGGNVGGEGDGGLTPSQRRKGTLLYFDTSFNNLPEYGDGSFILIGPFQTDDDKVEASYEEAEGSPFACKAYEKTAEEFNDPGVDIGTLDFSIEGSAPIPPCKQVDGDWACIGASGAGGDIALVDDATDVWSLTVAGTTFTADEVGRVLKVSGATNPANDGMFAIVDVVSGALHFYNPRAEAAAETATAAQWRTESGEGPSRQDDPIANDQELRVELTPNPDGLFEPFTKTLDFGDEFLLDNESRAVISNLPMDGSEFTIGCDGDGGECNEADATAINIETTDGDIDPAFPGEFPKPKERSVLVFCLFLIGHSTVPAEASQFIADSGATRIRTVFARADSAQEIQEGAEITVVAGHAIAGFTDP